MGAQGSKSEIDVADEQQLTAQVSATIARIERKSKAATIEARFWRLLVLAGIPVLVVLAFK
jgi:hypothetical protein